MSVSPASSRAGWHTSQPAGPGRPPGAQRRPSSAGAPALTVTLSIPLSGEEALTPSAQRLLDAARELIEHGQATVIPGPTYADRRTAEPAALRPPPRPVPESSQTGPSITDPNVPEVRILAASRSVLVDGQPLPLTRLEFDLLLHLVEHPRRVFTRLQLLAAVWGYEHTGVRTVDVHVRRLRGKVGADVPLVTTVYGVGYRLADEARVTVDQIG
ncbi:winged helix-turn-helix domain-containing protein [Micromonospora sp. NBC_01796]|uniref:winged helix-turn-helix domain-containing protein n=1 Tax=Micromonospora sp. NBC_01796 TaxID=2975987 RepID=UPI002DD8CBE9|nr:winged helix-turn-helix domain-containing protein [Micromonospora sp. NBC_01796]WSA85339.1 winged helix-turn-helix domain-containing protein [Micromonospora sp. NBC_01796]